LPDLDQIIIDRLYFN